MKSPGRVLLHRTRSQETDGFAKRANNDTKDSQGASRGRLTKPRHVSLLGSGINNWVLAQTQSKAKNSAEGGVNLQCYQFFFDGFRAFTAVPTISPPCPTPQSLGSPTRTQSELLITSSHRGWCQISSLDMEMMTALENNLLFIAGRRRTQSLKEEKLAWFGSATS